jgi:hypothetical protein
LIAGNPPKKGKPFGKITLQTIKFKINTDVPNRFQLDIPADTPVFDYSINKERPFSELKNPQQ